MSEVISRESAMIWLDEAWKILHLDPGAASLFSCIGNEFRGLDLDRLPGEATLVGKDGVIFGEGYDRIRQQFRDGLEQWEGLFTLGGHDKEGPTFHAKLRTVTIRNRVTEGYLLSLTPRANKIPTSGHGIEHMEIREAWHAVERPIYLLTPDGLVLTMNESARRSSSEGLTDRLMRPIWEGLDWRNVRDERESLRMHVLRAGQGEAQQMILRQGRRFSSPDRSILMITITPVRSPEGTVKQLVLDEWFVPVALQMEIKMSMTESIFRSFLDQNPLPTWLTDPKGKLIAMSHTYAEFFGLSNEDIGKDIMQLIPHRFVLQYTRQNEMVMQTGQHLHVLENWMSPEGQVRTHIVHKFPIRTGREITMIGAISFEVTEKLRVEEGIRVNYERFYLANKATHELIWDWDIDSDSVILLGNPDILWTSGEKEVHTPDEFFGKMHPDDRYRTEKMLRNALRDHSCDDVMGSYLFPAKDGHYVRILDRACIIRDDLGRAYRVVGSAIQVTDRIKEECNRVLQTTVADEQQVDPLANLEESLRKLPGDTEGEGGLTAEFFMAGLKKLLQGGWDPRVLLPLLRRFVTWSRERNARHVSVHGTWEQGKVILRLSDDRLETGNGQVGQEDWPLEFRQALEDARATVQEKTPDQGSMALIIAIPV